MERMVQISDQIVPTHQSCFLSTDVEFYEDLQMFNGDLMTYLALT
jgi:hypothetical protein